MTEFQAADLNISFYCPITQELMEGKYKASIKKTVESVQAFVPIPSYSCHSVHDFFFNPLLVLIPFP